MKRWQSILLAGIVSAATLAYALRGVQLDALVSELAHGKYGYIVPSVALIVVGLWLRSVRWRVLLNNRIEMGQSFHILNSSYLFNAVLPLRLGEIVRAFLATRLEPPIPIFTSLSTVVVERLTDVIAVLVVVIIAMLIAPVTPEVRTAAEISGIVAVIGVLVLMVFAARPALAHRILGVILRVAPFLERLNLRSLADRVLDGIAPLGSLRGAFTIFAWTAISWISSVLVTYVLMFTFYDQPQWNAALLITSIASLAIALPAVPGSVGPFEAATVAGLTISGMAAAGNAELQTRAVACAVLFHITTTGSYVVLGMIGLAQERISLGEVMRAARQMASRSTPPGNNEEAPASVEPVAKA